jgi:hypothetical protein
MATKPVASHNVDQEYGKPAKAVLLDSATNEVVFAVVGYVGSVTSEIASALKGLLEQEKLEGGKFDVEILKARKVISDWAARNGEQAPNTPADNLATTRAFQDLGDKMRSRGDHAIVARELIQLIRLTRATKLGILQGITKKYSNAGVADAEKFMTRDARAKEKYGQRVSDAFHMADFFVASANSRNRHERSVWRRHAQRVSFAASRSRVA